MPTLSGFSCWLPPLCWSSKRSSCAGVVLGCSSSTPPSAGTGSPTPEGDSGGQRVCIDADTEVPFELYLDLVDAGRRARARGQHHMVRPKGGSKSVCGVETRQPLRRPTHLVSS